MTDQLDLQIAESLRRVAATAPSRGAGFGDVRRRARLRRQRNLAFAAVPAVLGTAALGSAAIGMRPAGPANVPSANAPDTIGSPASTTSLIDTPTMSTVVTSTLPVRLPVGTIVCLDAGAGAVATAQCVEEFGGDSFAAGSLSAESFVMPVDPTSPTHQADAEWLGSAINLPVHPYEFPAVPEGVDFIGTGARVFVVLGQSNPPNTAPIP